MNSNNLSTATTNIAYGSYQAKVMHEAFKRAGHCPNLKGHIHEIMFKDSYNSNIINIMNGKHAQLTASPYSIRDDIIVKQGNKIIFRAQLKNTPSNSGINDVAKRVSNGQYKGTNLLCPKEQCENINKAIESSSPNTKIRAKDSGISSKTTELLALEVNGANPLKHLDLVAHNAKEVAKGGAIVGGGISAIKNGYNVAKGKRDVDEAIVSVATDTGKSAIAAGIGGAVDATVTMATALTPAAPFAKPLGTASGIVTGILVDKGLNYTEHRISQHYDKKIKNSIYNANDSYGYLKRRGIF